MGRQTERQRRRRDRRQRHSTIPLYTQHDPGSERRSVRGVGGGSAVGVIGQGGPTSAGVIGHAGSGNADGVQGFGAGTFSGVAGFGDPNGSGIGVFGAGQGVAAPGVRGIGSGGPNTVPGDPCGIYGQAGRGPANGVEGHGSLEGAGVAGFGDPASGTGRGRGAPGVRGIGAGAADTVPGNPAGVYGQAGSGNAATSVGAARCRWSGRRQNCPGDSG
jgi:hypothetical protein